MSIETISNYLRVSESVSSSGQPDEAGFRSIAAAGFRAVINLAMPDSDGAIADEGRIVTQLGMSYHHIPVPFDAPKVSQLTQFFGLMDALENEKVWVHCVLNYRVSAFLYLYRRWKGLPEGAARRAMLPAWQPDDTWQKFMTDPTGGERSTG